MLTPWAGKPLEQFERDRPLFEHLLDVVPDAVLGVNASGGIVFANVQAATMFGASKQELIAMRVEDLIPERLSKGHSAKRSTFFSDPQTRQMGAGARLSALRTDGTEFPVDINLTGFTIGDELIAAAAIRDVSDRVEAQNEQKRLERQLAEGRMQRLESIGALAGGIAHDFNNLLGVIINYADFAADAVEDPAIRDDIHQIQGAAMRAAALTRQLLIFSRREVVQPAPFELNALLENLERLLRRTLGEQIELQTTFAGDLWTVIADPGQIEQIAVNLAINARDAMPDGGLLQISTENVVLDEEYLSTLKAEKPVPGNYVRLTVADSGVGMSAEVADRAFEPFFTTKDKSKGTGLGLATVYGIVKQAGGAIFLYSELDRGTTVKIYLPASELPAESEVEGRRAAPSTGNGERILVVEDEEAVRNLVERVLSDAGFTVVACAEPEQALARLETESEHFDLLLTDVVMPRIAGRELAARATAASAELKVLLMSGYSEEVVARIDGRKNHWPLVEKPFTREQLVTEVLAALAGATTPAGEK